MVEDLSPDRFPLHFVSERGYMFFSDWNWNNYYTSKELLVLESIPAVKFVENSEKDKLFSVDKDFFEDEAQYLYFILLRLMLGTDHFNIYSLDQSVELVHIFLMNETEYKKNKTVKELDEPVGNWRKFDLISYRDRKSTRLNSSHTDISRMPSSA